MVMALGPKAMGDAIAANLEAKTGKTLEGWLADLAREGLHDREAALAWLKGHGLGHFQAQLVVQKHAGEPLYDDPEQLLTELFRTQPEQRATYEAIVRELARDHRFVVNPCKGYVPLYSPRNRIFASFVPTRDGLYVGLVGDGFDVPTVPHRASRGGSERMTVGALCPDVETGVRLAAQSYRNDMAKG